MQVQRLLPFLLVLATWVQPAAAARNSCDNALLDLLNMAIDANDGRDRHLALAHADRLSALARDTQRPSEALNQTVELLGRTRYGHERVFAEAEVVEGLLENRAALELWAKQRAEEARAAVNRDFTPQAESSVLALRGFIDRLEGIEALEKDLSERGYERLSSVLKLSRSERAGELELDRMELVLRAELQRGLGSADEIEKSQVMEAWALIRRASKEVENLSFDELADVMRREPEKAVRIALKHGDLSELSEAGLDAAGQASVDNAMTRLLRELKDEWERVGPLENAQIEQSSLKALWWKGDVFAYVLKIEMSEGGARTLKYNVVIQRDLRGFWFLDRDR